MKRTDYDLIRAALWKEVVVACCQSSNCTNSEVATNWADHAVKKFDEKFEATFKSHIECPE